VYKRQDYHPDHITPPGDSLLDVLADRLGLDAEMLHRIIIERDRLTRDDARQLEDALGTPGAFWLERERRYREFLQKAREK
jgi:plasmid maintenance system antidote protein VapI